MDEKPATSTPGPAKRGWFQIHLLTAVALMIVAGPLLGANLGFGSGSYGWPFVFISHYDPSGNNVASAMIWSEFLVGPLVFDLVCAMLCLTYTGFIFEARAWGWSGGKIFVWAFIGAALALVILNNLFQLIAEATGMYLRPHI